ncbi:hypothetical protein [Streptomyces cucumeris]
MIAFGWVIGWMPVCVLGPLSAAQKVELRNAVATHTGASLWVNRTGW